MAVINERKNKKGTRYQAIVRVKGYTAKCKTFAKKTDARNWAIKTESMLKDGKYKEIKTKENTTTLYVVEDLIIYFKENEAPDRYAEPSQYNVMYDWWINKIGHTAISDLTSSVLSQCKDMLASEPPDKPYKNHIRKSNSTVNKYLYALSAILKYAEEELEIIGSNPMAKVKKKKKPNGRTRFLSNDEIKLLINRCKEHSERLYIFVLILLTTGARYNEVRHLTVENIDYKNKLYHFLNTKNNEHRGVPANEFVLIELKKHLENRGITEGCIFLNDKKEKLTYFKGQLEDIIEELKLDDVRIHDIRHTTASYIAMNGGSLLDIAEVLGHKSLEMARRYSHLTQKHTSTVLNRANEAILPI